MNARSWLDAESSSHIYRMLDGKHIRVDNSYQEIPCPHCQEGIFCRLTHIWLVGAPDPPRLLEVHNNYKPTLVELKELLISYNGKGGPPITEREQGGKWVLLCEGNVIGQTVNTAGGT